LRASPDCLRECQGNTQTHAGPAQAAARGDARAKTAEAAALFRVHGKDSLLARALGRDLKLKISVVIYVAAVWFCPDPRFERLMIGSQS
jgi:hypothetical protein